jgi:hypothetical protein
MSDDCEIGYGKPPRDHQFQPGKSGNPNGRPKGSKNLATLVVEELSGVIQVRENGKLTKISKLEAVLKSTLAKAIKGDLRAARSILDLAERHYPDEDTGDEARELSDDENDILDQYIEKILHTKQGDGGDENK